MSLLFVTSFSPPLYEASGKKLLDSFYAVGQAGKFLVCHEGMSWPGHGQRDAGYDLDTDSFLNDWLAANRDIIPEYLGGTARECTCPGRRTKHGRHRFGCHWSFMNRTASKFFRKVAAFRAAVHEGTRLVVWLDADAYFKKNVPEAFVRQTLAGTGLCYCKGHRPAVESGVLGFDMLRGGAAFVKALCRRYTSAAFRKDERWDDGAQEALVLRDKKLAAVDLVHPTHWRGRTNDVIPHTVLNEYFAHEKGAHSRNCDIHR